MDVAQENLKTQKRVVILILNSFTSLQTAPDLEVLAFALLFDEKASRTGLVENVDGAVERLVLVPVAGLRNLPSVSATSCHSSKSRAQDHGRILVYQFD